MTTIGFLFVASLSAQVPAAQGGEDVMRLTGELVRLAAEVRGLREQLALQELAMRKRDEGLTLLGQEVHALTADVAGLKDRPAFPVSAAFITGPPQPSDAMG